jgi:hypothetical protein
MYCHATNAVVRRLGTHLKPSHKRRKDEKNRTSEKKEKYIYINNRRVSAYVLAERNYDGAVRVGEGGPEVDPVMRLERGRVRRVLYVYLHLRERQEGTTSRK